MSEIKPCPFCGKRGILGQTILNYYVVRCTNEKCNMIVQHHIGTTREEAIKTWNTRPAEDALRVERDELKADAERLAELVEGSRRAYDLMGLNGVDRITPEGFDNLEQVLTAHRVLVEKYKAKKNNAWDKLSKQVLDENRGAWEELGKERKK